MVRSRVHSAVEALPPLERSLIELAYWSDLSQSQIAARLGMPLGPVKTGTGERSPASPHCSSASRNSPIRPRRAKHRGPSTVRMSLLGADTRFAQRAIERGDHMKIYCTLVVLMLVAAAALWLTQVVEAGR